VRRTGVSAVQPEHRLRDHEFGSGTLFGVDAGEYEYMLLGLG